MTETTKKGLSILGAALLLGVAGDALLRIWPWGPNGGLWLALLVIAAVALISRHDLPMAWGARGLLLAAVAFVVALAWRDSPVIASLNLLAGLAALGLANLRSRTGRIDLAGWTEYARAITISGLSAAVGFFGLMIDDVNWQEIPCEGWLPQAMAVGRGLLIGVPLLFVFGGLFVAADAAFAGIVGNIIRLTFEDAIAHILTIGLCAWLVGGFFRPLLAGDRQGPDCGPLPAPLHLGATEVGVALGSLDALFLAFVVVQLRYFFGGAPLVEASTTLSYAEYARRGFFELVAVAALVLPTLLLADWLLRRESARHERMYGLLAAALVALLYVVMASAVQRMRLYQEEFGLTELRVYTTAFMGWLALVFLWFAATVLRGDRERFAFGALLAGFAVIAFLNVLNPDDLIVRVNAGRLTSPYAFDGRYAAALSADAVPALVEALPLIPEQDRPLVAKQILQRWSPPVSVDWRTWNGGRAQAWQVVAQHEEELWAAARQSR